MLAEQLRQEISGRAYLLSKRQSEGLSPYTPDEPTSELRSQDRENRAPCSDDGTGYGIIHVKWQTVP
jgi:hypothetical protein